MRVANWMLLPFLAACGGTAVVDGEPGVGGGANTTTTGPTTTTSSSNMCVRTNDSFEMVLETYQYGDFGCSLGTGTLDGAVLVQGVVLEAGAGYLMFDSCPPSADCDDAWVNELSYTADGLDADLPPLTGSFVQVEAFIDDGMGCSQQLLEKNLPEWDNVTNPVLDQSLIFLVGGDGTVDVLDGAGFGISSEALGCYPDELQDDHLLSFDSGVGAPVNLLMGETGNLEVAPGPGSIQLLSVRNLRSFDPAVPDDYGNWGYWAHYASAP